MGRAMNAHLEPDRLAGMALAAGGSGDDPHLASCRRCRDQVETFRRLAEGLTVLPEPPAALREQATAYFSRRKRLDDLVERLLGDPALRARVARDATGVLREAGLEPTPALVAAVRDTERAGTGADRRLAARSLWF